MKNIIAVILAAGKGTRMKSEAPKVLHEVGGKPILERVIGNLRQAGIEETITVVGHKAEKVKALFEKETQFVEQKELLGSGHALAQAAEMLPDEGYVLVACGDAPLIKPDSFKSLMDRHEKENAACTVLTCEMEDPFSYGRILRDKDGSVLKIVEEKDLATEEERNIKEINTGTYCFNASDVKAFVHKIKMNEKKQEFYLTDIVDILKSQGRTVTASSCTSEESIGINSRADLAVANGVINMKKIKEVMDSGVTVVDPDNTYIADDAVIGKDTVILQGTVIDGGVKIGEGCKIGPLAHLRTGTELQNNVEVGNFTEINRTKIGEGSKVKHQAYLGDTVVGKNVNVGAGVITANYDGKNKNQTVIEDGAFIGVGARLVAPVKIGKEAVVGAGAVVTKEQNVQAGETVVGVPAKPIAGGK